MFYALKGKVEEYGDNFCALDVNGVVYKINTSLSSMGRAKRAGEEKITFYTYLHVREDILDLYGFADEFELLVFKKIIVVSGIGPKTALTLLNVAGAKELVAAINEGRPELLTKVAGIGKKTAERAVLELKDKIEMPQAAETVAKMESNADLEEALLSLGYKRDEVRQAIEKINTEGENFQERFREALKFLGANK